MKETFKLVINEAVKPVLKKSGFKKKGLNFYKHDNGLIFLINIQKSHGNSSTEIGFYINCAMHSIIIDEVLDESINEFPKEYQCHFNQRIEKISTKALDKFILNSETNLEALKGQLSESLEETLEYFSTIPDTASFVAHLSKAGTLKEDEVFRYCIREDFTAEATELVRFFERNIDAERWEEVFKGRFIEILEEENADFKIKCLE